MTKTHSKIYNKLRHRQVNANDVRVVSYSDTSITFFIAFPGLYLTYDRKGELVQTETRTERRMHGLPMVDLTQQLRLGGEVGR